MHPPYLSLYLVLHSALCVLVRFVSSHSELTVARWTGNACSFTSRCCSCGRARAMRCVSAGVICSFRSLTSSLAANSNARCLVCNARHVLVLGSIVLDVHNTDVLRSERLEHWARTDERRKRTTERV